MAGGLLTDLYELNMAASYIRRGMQGEATFSLFVRQLPSARSFLVAAGIESCLTWLENFSFEPRDLEFLGDRGFDRDSIEAFSQMRFSGELWAVPEGRIVFAGEPMLEVSAPMPEAQVLETLLLNQVTFPTSLASKAARCRIAARDEVQLVEFGFRRTQGIEAAMEAARLAALVGFAATSNVEAARRYGLSFSGTIAHSFVEAFETEEDAFRALAEDLSTSPTFLVDTYDTTRGLQRAIEAIKEHDLETVAAVRLDSGDLASLARQARRMLDDAGLSDVRIFLTGGLDEKDIDTFVKSGTPFDAVGVGTRLGVCADAPYLDSVYKLVEYEGRPVMKLSPGKTTLPGAKQVFRFDGLRDLIGLREEEAPRGSEPLLQHVMCRGRRVAERGSLDSARALFESDLSSLPAPLRDLDSPVKSDPDLTPALRELADQVAASLGGSTYS